METTTLSPTSTTSKRIPSPYVVLRQKNVHEMRSLVLELDNNLSFGSTRAESSNSDSQNEMEMTNSTISKIESPLKNVQMDTSNLYLCDKNLIGKGTYATVYKCQLHGTDVAVKAFNTERHTPEVIQASLS